MTKDFVLNIAIIISYLFIIGQISQKIHPNRHYNKIYTTIRTQIGAGFIFGFLGIILMLTSLDLTESVIIDLRHIATVVGAVFFGIPAALISAIVISLSRIIFFELNSVSINALVFMLLIGVICAYVSTFQYKRLVKFLIMNIVSTLLIYLVLYLNVESEPILFSVYTYYWAISLFGGYLVFYVARYIFRANENYFELDETSSRLKTLISCLNSGILVEDESRKIIEVNQTFCEMFGIPSVQSIIGKRCDIIAEDATILFHEKDYFVDRINEIVKNEQAVTEELSLVDGRIFERDFIPIYSDGLQTMGSLWNYRDITDRKRAECKLKEANETLQQLYKTDSLTGIPNRRSFDEMVEKEWNRAKRKNTPISLMILDIDNYKAFNDAFGHLEGDKCLKKVASTISQLLNRSGDYVARYGGEEFTVILPETDLKGAAIVAESFRSTIESLQIGHIDHSVVTISIGVATATPIHSLSYIELIQKADKALYEAKNNGKNRIELYSMF